MNQAAGSFTALSTPVLAWTEFVLLSAQMLVTSAQVIGHRTSRMLLAGATPNERDQREFNMMSEEKTAAAVQSAQAMAQGAFKLSQQLAVMAGRQMLSSVPMMMSLASSTTSQQTATRQMNLARAGMANAAEAQSRIVHAMPRIAAKGLKPIHSKATANRKRLAKHANARASGKSRAHQAR